MSSAPLQPLSIALKELTMPHPDLKTRGYKDPGLSPPGTGVYDWYHVGPDFADNPDTQSTLIGRFLDSQSDEERLLYAEDYADRVLRPTNLADACWFRIRNSS